METIETKEVRQSVRHGSLSSMQTDDAFYKELFSIDGTDELNIGDKNKTFKPLKIAIENVKEFNPEVDKRIFTFPLVLTGTQLSAFESSQDSGLYPELKGRSIIVNRADGLTETYKVLQDGSLQPFSTLKALVDKEIADRKLAVDAEEQSRIHEDTVLQENLDAEISARTSADNTLAGNISSETTARQSADNQLRTDLKDRKSVV